MTRSLNLTVAGRRLSIPFFRESSQIIRTWRNWRSVLAARAGLRGYPVVGVRRDGLTPELHRHTEVRFYTGGGRIEGEDLIVPYRKGVYRFRGPADYAGVLGEVFYDEEYRWLPVRGAWVVDIGAAIGDSAIYFAARGAEGVVAYEIDPDRAAQLSANIAANGLSGRIRGRPVKLRTFGEAAEGIPDGRDAVLKIDCEGCEYPMLESSSKRELRRFRAMIMEYHYGVEPVVQSLEAAGFRVTYTGPYYPTQGPDLGKAMGIVRATRRGPPGS